MSKGPGRGSEAMLYALFAYVGAVAIVVGCSLLVAMVKDALAWLGLGG